MEKCYHAKHVTDLGRRGQLLTLDGLEMARERVTLTGVSLVPCSNRGYRTALPRSLLLVHLGQELLDRLRQFLLSRYAAESAANNSAAVDQIHAGITRDVPL